MLVAVAALGLGACTGGSDQGDQTPTPPSGPATSTAGATRTPLPSLPPPAPTAFDFESDAISFTYGTEWRISAATDQSITLTLKEAPGLALLTVRWQPRPTSGDLEQQYLRQLATAGRALEQLTDSEIDGAEAHRYASLIGQDETAAIALSVLFNTANTAYLVTFTSPRDDFAAQAPLIDDVLDTISLP